MLEALRELFSQTGFMPHNHCYLAKPPLVWTMFWTDLLIGTAYVAISFTLWTLIRRIRLPFTIVVLYFGLFILACGLTHFMEVWTLWNPDYWVAAAVKAVTAAASVGTGIYLFRLRHAIVTVAEAAKLAEQHRLDLEVLNRNLEQRVEERTRALVESEQKLQILADSVPNLVWMADSEGSIYWYNRRWYEYTGKSPDEMKGWGWQSVHHPDELPWVRELWKKSIREGIPFEMEFPLRGADDQFQWFLTRVVPARDESGSVIRWYGSNTNIESERQMRKSLEQAVRARDEFLSICSHELKTPLTSLLLQTQLATKLLERNDPAVLSREAVEQRVKGTIKQAHRMLSLVEEMLDVSRISSGQMQLQLQPLDLGVLIQEIIQRYSTDFVTLEFRFENATAAAPVLVNGDPHRLEQVFSNLLTNAVKYGLSPVTVTLSRSNAGARISVRDQGPGIARKDLERIFGRFERAVSSDNISGLGIGLYVCHQVIHAHQGRIWAESEPGQGATFIIELPTVE